MAESPQSPESPESPEPPKPTEGSERTDLPERERTVETKWVERKFPEKKTRPQTDPAKLKLAEVLYYEGKTVKEIAKLTGLNEKTVQYHAYQKPHDAWAPLRRNVASLHRETTLGSIESGLDYFAQTIQHVAQRLFEDIVRQNKRMSIDDIKKLSDIIQGQSRTIIQALEVKGEGPAKNQTNIQINMTNEEAGEILVNDPTVLKK